MKDFDLDRSSPLVETPAPKPMPGPTSPEEPATAEKSSAGDEAANETKGNELFGGYRRRRPFSFFS